MLAQRPVLTLLKTSTRHSEGASQPEESLSGFEKKEREIPHFACLR
jgi:hypothetical protein